VRIIDPGTSQRSCSSVWEGRIAQSYARRYGVRVVRAAPATEGAALHAIPATHRHRLAGPRESNDRAWLGWWEEGNDA